MGSVYFTVFEAPSTFPERLLHGKSAVCCISRGNTITR